MKVSCYHFFFHPCHEMHTTCIKALAVITNVALSILSFGLYFVLFLGVRSLEGRQVHAQGISPTASSNPKSGYVGNAALKAKLIDHLGKLQAHAKGGNWQLIQTHIAHLDSGFDWWMFPSDRASRGQGDLYQLSAVDIAALKSDWEFMQAYREGVCLVALSWGWDLKNEKDVTDAEKHWADWTIRLEKMLYSLKLFGEEELRRKVSRFVKQYKISLAPWAQPCLV